MISVPVSVRLIHTPVIVCTRYPWGQSNISIADCRLLCHSNLICHWMVWGLNTTKKMKCNATDFCHWGFGVRDQFLVLGFWPIAFCRQRIVLRLSLNNLTLSLCWDKILIPPPITVYGWLTGLLSCVSILIVWVETPLLFLHMHKFFLFEILWKTTHI